MTTTLISFLGGAKKGDTGYHTTQYYYPDGTKAAPAAFVGWPLREYLKPERMVILGTAGSMWDHLFEHDIALGDTAEEDRVLLIDQVAQKTVEQALLDRLAPVLSQHWQTDIVLQIIPYAQIEAEQLQLLHLLTSLVNDNETIYLDVTHGFRHLPMLGLLAALYLRQARGVEVKSIWYGAYDPETGNAPLHDLAGLLRIADWIGALHTFDKDGDYSAFSELLKLDHLPAAKANHLDRAAFYERINRVGDAARELANFSKVLDEGLPGIGSLFNQSLQERTRWYKGRELAAQQKQLAYSYLQRRDYVRATIFAYEGFVSSIMPDDKNINNYQQRKDVATQYEEDYPSKDFQRFKGLRNALAHGNRPGGVGVIQFLADEEVLISELRRLFNIFIPK